MALDTSERRTEFHEAVDAARQRRGPSAHPKHAARRGDARPTLADGYDRRPIASRDAIYRRLLAVADVLSAAAALVVVVILLGGDSLELTTLVGLPVVGVVSKLIGLYDRDELVLQKSTLDEAPKLFQLASLYALLTWLAQPVFVDGSLDQAEVLGLWAALFLFVLVGRTLARAAAAALTPLERCLLVGDDAAFSWMREKIAASPTVRAELVGHLPLKALDDAHDRRLRRDGDRVLDRRALEGLIEEHGVQRVILAPRRGAENDQTLDIISSVKGFGVKVSILPRMFEVVGSSVEFDALDGFTMLGVRRFGLPRSSRAIKRTFDLVGSAAVLALASPLLVLFAVLVKLSSPGPILFRQTRIGRDGCAFQMLKFRSMIDGADAQKADLAHLNEADGLFKIAEDPRVTRIGRLLRRTSLDELPQLFNVLRGEMSLVGPRPLVVEDDQRVQGWHRRRLHLTPGMTGQWQVLGSSRIPLNEMLTIDYLYVANWSLWIDVKILLRTAAFVVRGQGI